MQRVPAVIVVKELLEEEVCLPFIELAAVILVKLCEQFVHLARLAAQS